MRKSTTSGGGAKPAKPHPDFPLFPHAAGVWAKKIRGKLHYFGPWSDPAAALEKYLDEKDDLLAGRTPRGRRGGLTIKGLGDHFLTHKQDLLDSGELAPRTFARYRATCQFVADVLGKDRLVEDLRPEDFQFLRARMAKRWGPVALGNEIQIVRSLFRYGVEAELREKAVRFGPAFKKPSAKTLRMTRAAAGPQMFTREEILRVLDCSTVNMRAMLLLGINGALGNTDLGLLPIDAVDIAAGWLDYARSKTGVPRKIKLWKETIGAIQAVLAARRLPNDPADNGLLFIGRHGQSYVGHHKGYRVTSELNRVLAKAKVTGRNFYDLRRTFQTIAEEAHDLAAVQSIMGHAPAAGDMSAVYRQRVSDDRLKAVADCVRRWLFGSEKTK
jgi:integrase